MMEKGVGKDFPICPPKSSYSYYWEKNIASSFIRVKKYVYFDIKTIFSILFNKNFEIPTF